MYMTVIIGELDFFYQSQGPSEEPSTSSEDIQSSAHRTTSDDIHQSSAANLSSRYTVSEDHQKSKEQFMEKERENVRMEAKRRKLMEKRVSQNTY